MAKRKNKGSIFTILFALVISIGIIIFLENSFFGSVINGNDIKETKKDNKINIKKEDKKDKENNNSNSTTNNNGNSNIMKDDTTISEPAKTEKEENKQENINNITVKIELIGEEEVIISKGEKYNDLGAKAVDSTGKDVSDKIKIDNTVNTNNEGTYTVTYSIGNSIVMRYVIVK